jgi:cell division protein FtsQ
LARDRRTRRRPRGQALETPRDVRHIRWPVVLAILPIMLVAAGTYALLQSPYLRVQEVRVAGAQTLDERDMIAISDLYGKSMLNLPSEAVSRRLQALPQVRTARVSRSWPNGAVIHVEEREPAAFWSVNGRDYVVDAEGVVLAAGVPDGPAPRIVEVETDRIMGPGDRVHPDAIALAQRILAESPAFLGKHVDVLEYRHAIGVIAVFEGGMRVTFGDERSYEYKVAVLAKLLDSLSAQSKRAQAVDLRFGERVTYE